MKIRVCNARALENTTKSRSTVKNLVKYNENVISVTK